MGEVVRKTIDENERVLVELLLRALASDEVRGRRVLQAALADSGRDHVPEHRSDLVVFARAHLVPRVIVLAGVRSAASLLEELEALIEPVHTRVTPPSQPALSSNEPASNVRVQRLSVVLIDADSLSRTGLARTLVQAACDVTAGETASEVIRSLTTIGDVDAMVFDPSTRDLPLLASSLIGKVAPPLVAWTRLTGETATALVRAQGLNVATIVSKTLSLRQVTFAIRAIAIANRRASVGYKSSPS